jgi:hypothetical protein
LLKLAKCDAFTTFLGRYGKGDADPVKTYNGIPTCGSSVVVEFDFYEIDSWEKDQGDAAFINIDGVKIPIGIFDAKTDEGATSASVGDIKITTVSKGAPAQLCFRKDKTKMVKKWFDQKHHVTVTLPSSYVSDGQLVLKFETRVNGLLREESAGFDNLKIAVLSDCGGGGSTVSPIPASPPGMTAASKHQCQSLHARQTPLRCWAAWVGVLRRTLIMMEAAMLRLSGSL